MRTSSLCQLSCLALLFTTSLLVAEEPRVPTEIATLMQNRQFDEAVKAIDTALGKEDTRSADYLRYLKGRARHFQKKYDDAVKAFDDMAVKHPKSPWARRGRLAKGASLAAKGDYRAAEKMYRAEAGFLLSPDRKQEMSDIYLTFADSYFKPAKEEVKPNYKKALDFYQRALTIGPKPSRAMEVELRIALCNHRLKNYPAAINLLRTFVKEHADEPLVVEGRYQLGESQLAAKRREAARATWRDLLKIHAGSDSARLPEAAFRLSLTYNIPNPSDIEDLNLGVASLKAFIGKYPNHKLASLAYLRIAQSYQNLNRHQDAVDNLVVFLSKEQYAKTSEFAEAGYTLAYSQKMQQKFDEALKTWRDFLMRHSTHKLWSNAQREIINTEYLKAQYASTKKNYEDAIQQWQKFLAKYPLDDRSAGIQFRIGQIRYEQEKWQEAIQQWRRLVSKYPKAEDAARGQLMIGVTLERKLEQLDEALKEYKKVTWGKARREAALAIARLTKKTMTVSTERVFRTNETSQVRLNSRNIDEFKVNVYSIDLETYFRKMHRAAGVESLDIALIDPDKSFKFKVPKYIKYKQIDSNIDIPLQVEAKPGVTAVTVSSDKLEATTLVFRSDLDIVVKSSREELFVFAENMVSGKPWADVRILASDGKKVFAEGRTDAKGVFHKSFEELHKAGDVRVFALANGNSASNIVSLSGVGRAQGLVAKGLIYSDRPAYRPGQMVHLRGVIRKVEGDVYKSPAGQKFDLQVFNSRSQLIHKSSVTTNDMGSFHSRVLLSKAIPLGPCRVLVTGKQRERYQGAFLVHQEKIDSVRLTVETGRDVYYRGETIKGSIAAAFYYGAPLVGRQVRYRIGSGAVRTGKTDDEGKVYFELPTRRYRESSTLMLSAQLPARNLTATKLVLLATQAFQIESKLTRPVFLSDEPFELAIHTKDPLGKPVSRAVQVRVLRRALNGGGEVLAATHDVKTGVDGRSVLPLRIKTGGSYTLRVEGTDRFKNPVSDQVAVQISGQEDSVRLRILANRHQFKAGETAKLRIHWRESPALALLTLQGAKILDYRLLNLKQGANDVSLPMDAKLAPNFEVNVAVMQPYKKPAEKSKRKWKGLHTASSGFTVSRNLKVKLEVRGGQHPKPPRPGEQVDVVVTATDPQGQPAVAEFSLALVEQALLSRFRGRVFPADPKDDIAGYFRSRPRKMGVRTTSSISFRYQPSTRAINAQLLAQAEQARLRANRAGGGGDGNGTLRPGIYGGGFGGYQAGQGGSNGRNANAGQGGGRPATMPRNGQGQDRSSRPFTTSILPVVPGAKPQQPADPFADAQFQSATLRSVERLPQMSLAVRQSQQVQRGQAGGGASVTVPPGDAAPRAAIGGGAVLVDDKFDFRALYEERLGDIWSVDHEGIWRVVNLRQAIGSQWNAAQAQQLAKRLASRGSMIYPRLGDHETGFWNPRVVTDDRGQATVQVTLPQRSTGWSMLAKGITLESLAGQAQHDFAVKRELFGQLRVAGAYVDGDDAVVTAVLYNNVVEKGTVDVELKLTVGDKTTIQRKKVAATRKGLLETTFRQKLALPSDGMASINAADMVFELTVRAGDVVDVSRQSVPLRPNGLPIFSVASGSAAATRTAFLDRPANIVPSSARLQVTVGPNVERSLLDVVLQQRSFCDTISNSFSTQVDRAVSDLMAALALQKLLSKTQEANSPQLRSIAARINSTVSDLVDRQATAGSWSWGSSPNADRYTTAQVVWALSLAKEAGYLVPDGSFGRAVKYLQSAISGSGASDYETKVVLLDGLATAGKGDFTLANQSYRNRAALSAAGLARLALSFAEMDRKQTAGELLAVLSKQDFSKNSNRQLSWNGSEVEVRALYALALEKVRTADGKLKEQVDWLMEHRTGYRWLPDKATGAAMLTLCQWYARTQFQGEKYELTIYVNDLKAFELKIDEQSMTRTLDVPSNLLRDGRQRVRFELNGRGRFAYQCVLSGFVPSDKVKSTSERFTLARYYEPAPLERDGKSIPRGFSIISGRYKSFRNSMTQLAVARRGAVRLELTRNADAVAAPDGREYLVITEPVPAGTAVIAETVAGGFESFELRPGAITFYVGNRSTRTTITYEVFGGLPGDYHVTPSIVRNAYRLDDLAVSKPKRLTVLPAGQTSEDDYKLSPVELFELGKRSFAGKKFAEAAVHLNKLIENWKLNAKTYQQVVKMLLDIHLVQGPPQRVVKYFETIIEKYPKLPITFEDYLKIADAYDKIGEYERSYLVFRATIEANFQRESYVAGSLETEGDFIRSVAVMSDFLRQYPPEPYLASANYALAQRVYAKAPSAAKDAKLREQKVTREALIGQAIRRLDDFLTDNPLDPAADQASFSLASGLLELEQYKLAITACTEYAKRYADSSYLDSFWYIIGFCYYATGNHQEALNLVKRVAERKWKNPKTSRMEDSRNKWRAIYIAGQIHHSRGDAVKAIAEYERVKDRFVDARQAINYFARKSLKVPEVTTVNPKAPVKFELTYRNLPECTITVYRIDLLKFGLLRRNLNGFAQVNLAGIRPQFSNEIPLGTGKDYRDRKKTVTLPIKDEGAYLIVCRGGNIHKSGMVLVSPLRLEVEEGSSGLIGATVKNAVEKKFVGDVEVKVIGSADRNITSGETDLRGVFVADGIAGQVMVIARKGKSRYAFYRGTTHIPRFMRNRVQEPVSKSQLLRGLMEGNKRIQAEQQQQLDQLYKGLNPAEGKPSGKGGFGGGFGGGGIF